MMIMGSRVQLLAAFMGLLCMGTNGYGLGGANSKVQCKDNERQALLKFKQGFTSPSNHFSSWTAEEDCCKWRGVRCCNTTGYVITLDLHSTSPTERLHGELNPSLLGLPYLSHLDLSLNDFQQIQIPEFIGNLSNLKFLNLSDANFKGTIPNQLGNLSHLQSLDLSGFSLRVNNLDWLFSLSSLKILNLGGVDLSNDVNWLDSVNMLPSLLELRLFSCQLNMLPPSLPHLNFTSLKILDLSSNHFDSAIPRWLFNISHSLVSLKLKRNQLRGRIPDAFGNMTSLIVLDLSENNLTGGIPTTLGLIWGKNQLIRRHSSLKELRLSQNQLSGLLERNLAQLSELVVLEVAFNSLEGVITEAHLQNFSSLRMLQLSSNSLTLKVSSNWNPAFQLDIIGLQNCKLGRRFPQWLCTQNKLLSIDISGTGISGKVPDWFWNLSPRIEYMDLSYNNLAGSVPDFSSKLNLSTINLGDNNFKGPLPRFPHNMRSLLLSRNSFSGTLSSLCEMMDVNNSMHYLDLSSNLFCGWIPDCWTYGSKLVVLNLAYNRLSGNIPNSIGHLVQLKALRLDNNNISGDIPLPLKNCTRLFAMDVGRNRLSGKIPAWIGESLQNLMILSLRSNEFEGSIPLQLCQLKYTAILDLGLNRISGEIPRCIEDFLVLAEMEAVRSWSYDPYMGYTRDELVRLVGVEAMPKRSFAIKYVDLSSNMITGEIPGQLTSLIGLLYLNLSNNLLTGTIPRDIGVMNLLEALDLSSNQLSCSIPTSMPNLTFLTVLNLSHNNLSGEIPRGAQFQTFEESTYIGNPHLCSHPLTNNCSGDDPNWCPYQDGDYRKQSTGEEGDNGFEMPSFYISMGLGFMTGFWGFWIPLLFNRSWRYAYYRFLNNMNDKIYVTVAVNMAKLRRKFQSQQPME